MVMSSKSRVSKVTGLFQLMLKEFWEAGPLTIYKMSMQLFPLIQGQLEIFTY